jgi:hypothetical protein
MLERLDFLFSYWIFAWYILYELRIVSYNPKGALFLALLENMVGIMFMAYYSYSYLMLFFIIIIVIKVLPLWSIRNTPYHVRDVYATLVLLCIYLLWVYSNTKNINIVNIIKSRISKIKNNKPIGPIMMFYDRLRNK